MRCNESMSAGLELPKSQVDFNEVKAAARGNWCRILQEAGLPAECLERHGQPCPKCGGEDRYNAKSDVEANGAVFCRKCFTKDSRVKPGDGIATVAWLRDTSCKEAAQWIAEQLGLCKTNAAAAPHDVVVAMCREKRMPEKAFRLFGVTTAKRGDQPVARVDVYDESGRVHSHFDLIPGEKGKFKRGKGNSGMFFPGELPQAGETWLVVEGVKDAAALLGLGYKAAGMPSNKLSAKYAKLFAEVNVVLVPDLDAAGIRGSEHNCRTLCGVASSISIARLPGEVKETKGDDVRDVLQKPGGEAHLREAIENADSWNRTDAVDESGGPPKVFITMDEAVVTEEVIQRLGALGWDSPWIPPHQREPLRVYVRGGVLVEVRESDDLELAGRAAVRDLPSCLVRERITQACSLQMEKVKQDEVVVVPQRPPAWLIDSIARRGGYGGAIRPLTGVIESPTIRTNGSILQLPGYDPETGLIFNPSAEFPSVPDAPTEEDARKAIRLLEEVLVDFPLHEDADRSAWIAMVLSMIGRACIDGYVPLFTVTANIRGAGKSLLADAASLIAYGHRAARKAFTRDDDEMRKVITAVALAATPMVLFDNLDVQLGGAALDAAITSSAWSDRVLGQSRMTGDIPMRIVWSATGNNMAFGSDVARRVLPIRLDSPHETPEDRSDFCHPDLLKWVEKERPELAIAALTILRAYFVAGCPAQPGGEWGSFENWSSIIRGAIVWAGGADPLPTRKTALASDDTADLLGKLIAGIEQADPTGYGLTTNEIYQSTLGAGIGDLTNEVLAEAVFEICGDRFNPKTFGRRVRGLVGRVWQGRQIESQSARGGVKRWRVRKVDGLSGGFGGLLAGDSDQAIVKQCNAMSGRSRCVETDPLPFPAKPPKQPNLPRDPDDPIERHVVESGSTVEL